MKVRDLVIITGGLTKLEWSEQQKKVLMWMYGLES